MDNLGYIVAGYTITFLVITVYTVTLLRRVQRARRDVSQQAAGSPPG